MLTLDDVKLAGARVLVREDLNVPIREGVVTSRARIQAALPTLRRLLDAKAAVMVMSHLGRPTEGQFDGQYSLAPVAKELESLLGTPVRLVDDYLQGVTVQPGELVLFENVRFNVGEKADDQSLAKTLADLCDLFVMDAFGTAHRAQASTHGVANFAPIACAGPLLVSELNALGKALDKPQTPVVAIVGGAKVSTKLEVLGSLSKFVDEIVVGGGIANTFLAAAGYPVGKSLYEADLLSQAKAIMEQVDVPLPVDVVVAKKLDSSSPGIVRLVADVAEDEMILDLGPETARQLAQTMANAGTIIWNGPLGVFEIDQFGEGTRVMAEAIAESSAFSLAGGGDTLAAIEKYQVGEKLSYISTGGGAFLEFVEGKILPAVKKLQERADAQ